MKKMQTPLMGVILAMVVVDTYGASDTRPTYMTGNDTHGPVSADDYPKTTAGGPPSITTYKNLKWRTKKCAPCNKNETGVWEPAPCDCVQGFKYDEQSQTGVQNNNWGSVELEWSIKYGLNSNGTIEMNVLKDGISKMLGLGSGTLNVSVGQKFEVNGSFKTKINWSWQSDIVWNPVTFGW